jgi:hypothetical protein
MQKRTKKDMNLAIGETLLEFFIRNTLSDMTKKNMVQVLTHLNSFAFNQTELKRKEIENFGDYFISNGYEESTRKERIKIFGEDDAYILNIYYKLFEEEERKRILEEIKDITANERYEAMTLTDTIFHIKENKEVTLSTLDEPTRFTYYKENMKHTEILKQEFFNYMAYAIMLGRSAGIVVRIKKKPKDWLLGIRIEGGIWRPLPVYEFMEKDTELDLSVRYTEITRKV